MGIDALRRAVLGAFGLAPLVIGLCGIFVFITGEPNYSAFGSEASAVLWMLFCLSWALLGGVLLLAHGRMPDRSLGV